MHLNQMYYLKGCKFLTPLLFAGPSTYSEKNKSVQSCAIIDETKHMFKKVSIILFILIFFLNNRLIYKNIKSISRD